MNSGVNVNDPTIVAAFKAALLHQGLIALLIFALLGLVWVCVRALPPLSARDRAAAAGASAGQPTEPAWRQVLRIGFGLLWILDGILQAQPKMALGLPSQVIEPIAATSPRWVQHVVNWAGTTWSPYPTRSGSRVRRSQRSAATSPGPSGTTSPRSRWPRSASSTRSSPLPR